MAHSELVLGNQKLRVFEHTTKEQHALCGWSYFWWFSLQEKDFPSLGQVQNIKGSSFDGHPADTVAVHLHEKRSSESVCLYIVGSLRSQKTNSSSRTFTKIGLKWSSSCSKVHGFSDGFQEQKVTRVGGPSSIICWTVFLWRSDRENIEELEEYEGCSWKNLDVAFAQKIYFVIVLSAIFKKLGKSGGATEIYGSV